MMAGESRSSEIIWDDVMFIFSIVGFMGGEEAKSLMHVECGSASSSKKLFMTFSLDDAGGMVAVEALAVPPSYSRELVRRSADDQTLVDPPILFSAVASSWWFGPLFVHFLLVWSALLLEP